MGRGTKSLLRRQSLCFSLEEISLKESILRDHRSGHQVDGSSTMAAMAAAMVSNAIHR